MAMQREVGAVFEAFVLEPEPSRWQTSETDGQVERPTERERRSQHVEISVKSLAVASHPLRVALEKLFVGKALESLGFFSLMPVLWIVATHEVVEVAAL
jgi:hypothetical protein